MQQPKGTAKAKPMITNIVSTQKTSVEIDDNNDDNNDDNDDVDDNGNEPPSLWRENTLPVTPTPRQRKRKLMSKDYDNDISLSA